jgi:hypothetical protein
LQFDKLPPRTLCCDCSSPASAGDEQSQHKESCRFAAERDRVKKTADQVLWYRGEFGVQSCCRVRVYRPSAEERAAGRLDVVIDPDLNDNLGVQPLRSGYAQTHRYRHRNPQESPLARGYAVE